MRYAEKLDQLPVAGKAEEMRLIQVNTSNMWVLLGSIWSTWRFGHKWCFFVNLLALNLICRRLLVMRWPLQKLNLCMFSRS